MVHDTRHDPQSQDGFVLVAVIATLLPLLLIVGASSSLLIGNLSRVREAISGSKAFQAAESGIDTTIFLATIGKVAGVGSFTTNMGAGVSHRVHYDDIGIDSIDNDSDGMIDEADEKVIRVYSVGLYRKSRVTLVAYLGRSAGIVNTHGAVSLMATPDVQLWDSATIVGDNTNMNGTSGDPTYDLPGITTTAGNLPTLSSEINGSEASEITGSGASSPSIGTGSNNVKRLITSYKQQATNVIANVSNRDVVWGDSSKGEFMVSYASHLLVIKGNSRGAGVLVVEGKIFVEGTFKFDGLIITTDYVQMMDDATVNGSILIGPKRGKIHMHNKSKIRYSKQAMDIVKSKFGAGQYVLFNGWQRVAN